jgi:hypothetical protein
VEFFIHPSRRGYKVQWNERHQNRLMPVSCGTFVGDLNIWLGSQ